MIKKKIQSNTEFYEVASSTLNIMNMKIATEKNYTDWLAIIRSKF